MKRFYELIQKNFQVSRISDIFKKLNEEGKEVPLITMSREMGSGGRPIAYLVEKMLGKPWKVYHKEIVEEIVKTTNLEKQLVKEMDENKIPVIEEFIADVFGRRYPTLSTYHKHLARILMAIGQKGHVIIVGRGAHYLFPNALKVRIICEMEQRIKWEMEYEHINRKEAIKRIEESDKKRYEFEKSMYGHDPKKAHHYDLVVRTGLHLSIEDAANIIVTAARQRFV